jgi:hypothetical protein
MVYTMSEKALAQRKKASQSPNIGRDIGMAYKLAQTMKVYIAEEIEKNKAPLIQAMIRKAIDGDVPAFTALLDRAHGKPAQAVEVGGNDGQPIVFMPLALIQKFALEESQKPLQKEVVVVNNDGIKEIENDNKAN